MDKREIKLEESTYNNKVPILKFLSDARVVDFELMYGNKIVEVFEACDYHYNTALNKADMLQLIEELKEIAGRME